MGNLHIKKKENVHCCDTEGEGNNLTPLNPFVRPTKSPCGPKGPFSPLQELERSPRRSLNFQENYIASKLSADKLSRLREQSVGWNIKWKLKGKKSDCKIIMFNMYFFWENLLLKKVVIVYCKTDSSLLKKTLWLNS